MQVAIIKDVKHKDPWIPQMDSILPTGSLVVLVEDEPDGESFKVRCAEYHLPYYVHMDSLELIGEL